MWVGARPGHTKSYFKTKEGLSDETKSCVPFYLSVYSRASERPDIGGQSPLADSIPPAKIQMEAVILILIDSNGSVCFLRLRLT